MSSRNSADHSIKFEAMTSISRKKTKRAKARHGSMYVESSPGVEAQIYGAHWLASQPSLTTERKVECHLKLCLGDRTHTHSYKSALPVRYLSSEACPQARCQKLPGCKGAGSGALLYFPQCSRRLGREISFSPFQLENLSTVMQMAAQPRSWLLIR